MNYQSATNQDGLDLIKEYGKDQGLNFAIGWSSEEDLTNDYLYGNFDLKIVTRTPKEFETIWLNTHVCTAADKKNFNAPPASLADEFDENFEYGKFLCIDELDLLKIRGAYSSGNTDRAELWI